MVAWPWGARDSRFASGKAERQAQSENEFAAGGGAALAVALQGREVCSGLRGAGGGKAGGGSARRRHLAPREPEVPRRRRKERSRFRRPVGEVGGCLRERCFRHGAPRARINRGDHALSFALRGGSADGTRTRIPGQGGGDSRAALHG